MESRASRGNLRTVECGKCRRDQCSYFRKCKLALEVNIQLIRYSGSGNVIFLDLQDWLKLRDAGESMFISPWIRKVDRFCSIRGSKVSLSPKLQKTVADSASSGLSWMGLASVTVEARLNSVILLKSEEQVRLHCSQSLNQSWFFPFKYSLHSLRRLDFQPIFH